MLLLPLVVIAICACVVAIKLSDIAKDILSISVEAQLQACQRPAPTRMHPALLPRQSSAELRATLAGVHALPKLTALLALVQLKLIAGMPGRGLRER